MIFHNDWIFFNRINFLSVFDCNRPVKTTNFQIFFLLLSRENNRFSDNLFFRTFYHPLTLVYYYPNAEIFKNESLRKMSRKKVKVKRQVKNTKWKKKLDVHYLDATKIFIDFFRFLLSTDNLCLLNFPLLNNSEHKTQLKKFILFKI